MATVQLASQTPDQALVPGPALQEFDLPANTFIGGSGQLTYTATMADGSALPNWLMFLSTPTFGPSFLLDLAAPAKNQFSVMLTATDVATASSATETINFTVAGPVVSDHTPDQTWVVGQKVSLALAADTFNDFGLGLTVKATTLPGWLAFNATTGTFSGTAPATAGTFAVTLVATDAAALSTSETFVISVQLTPSYTPILEIPTPHQTVTQGQFVELDLPAKAFIDTNGTMTYAATLADGSALPAWLMFLSTPSFGPAFLLDLANPTATANAFGVILTATDVTSGLSASEHINFTMLGVPTVTDQTAAQVLVPGKTMSFALAADTFTDPQSQSLSLKATGMPGWLAFDASTGTFSGTAPTTAKSFAVTVAATDAIGLSGSETFNVGFLAPPVVAPTSAQDWLPGVLSFTLPADTFTDPNGEVLSYAATTGGKALPSWLSINPTTGIFSGVVPDNTTKSVLPITVTATDSSGLSASETFNVTVYADPLVKQAPAVTWKIGQVVTLAPSFSDPNALTLTYSAIMADGSAVPSWLHVNTATGAISGTVATGTASFALNVTATDTVGLSANETINVTILSPPVVTTTVAQTMAVYGQTATLALPQTTFVDPQHQAMTYAATLSSGAPLPTWLHFNAATETFSGAAPLGNLSEAAIAALTPSQLATAEVKAHAPSSLSLEVTATNSSGLVAHDIFTVNLVGVHG